VEVLNAKCFGHACSRIPIDEQQAEPAGQCVSQAEPGNEYVSR
jgi:hypothetical protein